MVRIKSSNTLRYLEQHLIHTKHSVLTSIILSLLLLFSGIHDSPNQTSLQLTMSLQENEMDMVTADKQSSLGNFSCE